MAEQTKYEWHAAFGIGSHVKDEQGNEVATVIGRTAEDEETKTYLLAAAPDLKAELQALADQVDAWFELGDAAADQPDTTDAHAAIAKATASPIAEAEVVDAEA